jgi:hypothetical protein
MCSFVDLFIESNNFFLIFYIIYYDFFKKLLEVNKKEKTKTPLKTTYKRAREAK